MSIIVLGIVVIQILEGNALWYLYVYVRKYLLLLLLIFFKKESTKLYVYRMCEAFLCCLDVQIFCLCCKILTQIICCMPIILL